MEKDLKIGPYTWKYEDDLDVISKDEDKDSKFEFGLCEYSNLKISVKKIDQPVIKKVVIVHELLHSFFYSAGYEPENEETIVEVLSSKIIEFLKENKEFFIENIL